MPTIDHLIYLKAPVDTCFERCQARGRPSERSLTRAQLHSMDTLYPDLIDSLAKSGTTVHTVDASGELQSTTAAVRSILDTSCSSKPPP